MVPRKHPGGAVVSEQKPSPGTWPTVVAFLGLLLFIAFLVWLFATMP